MSRSIFTRLICLLFVLTIVGTRSVQAQDVEAHQGVTTQMGELMTNDGVKLKTIVTKPAGASERLPAILFVQWLSCDPVALPVTGGDGWAAMMRRVIRESGALVWRTEKRGVGGSGGRCETLDYDTELSDHRAALAALRARPDVDPNRIVVLGGSMGATYAPLVAQGQWVAGVVVWGGGALTWAERMLSFERNALELGGTAPSELAREMQARYRLFDRYLMQGQTPAQILAADPGLGAAWSRIIGTSATGHYGRPFAFHQQAQRQNWAGAWAKVEAPVLVMYGTYDWFEDPRGASLIGWIVNRSRPGAAEVRAIEGLDHHFSRYASREDAFADRGGRIDADAAVDVMLPWLRTRLRLQTTLK